MLQVRDQFYYVIALHLHRARIVRLLRHVNRTCLSIVKIGKQRGTVPATGTAPPAAKVAAACPQAR